MSKLLLAAIAASTLFINSACERAIPFLNPTDKRVEKLLPQNELIPEDKIDLGSQVTTSFRPKVDILFIIDDSGSMNSHQAKLAANVTGFINAIKNDPLLDYHIGVTNSDQDNKGALVSFGGATFVTPTTPNLESVLAKNFKVGTSGDTTEKFLNIIRFSLTNPTLTGANRGFYRTDAALAIIFITDTDDQSLEDPNDIYDFLVNDLKGGDSSKIFAYGAFANPTYPSCSGENPRTQKNAALIQLAGGSHFSLCSNTFGQEFAKFGAEIKEGISNIIYLSTPPIVSSIQISFDSKLIPADVDKGWSFDPSRNAVILGNDVQIDFENATPGSQIEVRYQEAEYDQEKN